MIHVSLGHATGRVTSVWAPLLQAANHGRIISLQHDYSERPTRIIESLADLSRFGMRAPPE
jgi:hypothetical protein